MEETEQVQSQFRSAMLKAFRHGRAFKPDPDSDGRSDGVSKEDKHLPFAEWFARYYKNE